jgi:hypothetical protein
MAMYVRKDKVSEVISPPSNDSITPVTPAVTTTVQGGGGTAGAAGGGGGGAGSSGNEIQMPGTVIGETVGGIEETLATHAAADHDENMQANGTFCAIYI